MTGLEIVLGVWAAVATLLTVAILPVLRKLDRLRDMLTSVWVWFDKDSEVAKEAARGKQHDGTFPSRMHYIETQIADHRYLETQLEKVQERADANRDLIVRLMSDDHPNFPED